LRMYKRRRIMKKLIVLLILLLATIAHADRKVYMSYLTNGASTNLYVVQLSEKMFVENVISMPLSGTAGLTAIAPSSKPGEFFVYFNMRAAATAGEGTPNNVNVYKVPVKTNPLDFYPLPTPVRLTVKSNSLLNLSMDGNGQVGSLQRVNNRI